MSKLLLFFSIVANSYILVGQDSLKTVVAQQGDGIFSLLRKNNLNPSKFYNAFIRANKTILLEEEFLKAGQAYFIPDTTQLNNVKEKTSPILKEHAIFGKEFATVDSLSTDLKNTIYYLISGHGGPDPGAVADYKDTSIAEDEYAYDITLRLARELISHGAEVYLIIKDEDDGIRDGRILKMDTDEVTYPNQKMPLNSSARLKQRTKAVNKLYKKNIGKYQRLIVTHVDSRSESANIDVFFYHHKKSKNGKHLAESIYETFKKKYAKFQPNRGYQGTIENRHLYLIDKTLPPMTYIEVGNIQNKKDQKRILDPDNRQALAKWISDGIILDYNTLKN